MNKKPWLQDLMNNLIKLAIAVIELLKDSN